MLEVHEPGVVLLPEELDVVGGAVALLGHDDLGLATVHWTVWLGGILGLVLAAVLLLGWIS